MFTFTKKTDYALLALSFLATEGAGRLVGPREIARRYEIPSELLAKIMQTLSRHRLVASVPGAAGGYHLQRPATAIPISEIVEAVDGPLAIAQCWEPGGTSGCAQAQHCHLRGPLAQIQDEMTRLLQAMTLADVCPASAETLPPLRIYDEGRVLRMAGAAHPAGEPKETAPV